MEIDPTSLPGVVVLTPRRFQDDRGWFSETWSQRRMAEAGIDLPWVQDNQSFSAVKGTLRGLHYQAPPHAQAKLVRCVAGAILDIAVDVRRGSPTFAQWTGAELTAENGKQLLVPEGFLHGFVTLAPDTHVIYKCSRFYAPESDGSVRWDTLGIDWRLTEEPHLSAKDAAAPAFDDWTSPFVFEATS